MDFGFVFCRLCHFYAMSDRQVLRMPIRRFWLMQLNINRISAERDMRSLSVSAAAACSGDGIKQYRETLVLEIGNVAKVEEKLDKAGLSRLASLAG
jgi:hypothetical protein